VFLRDGILVLVALNLAVSTAIGVMILVRPPYPFWPESPRDTDSSRAMANPKTNEKGEKSDEETVD
jgi:hypothetical protein